MLMVVVDPDRVASGAEQEIPDLGLIVPCRLADTPYTRKELEARIKESGAPILVKDQKESD